MQSDAVMLFTSMPAWENALDEAQPYVELVGQRKANVCLIQQETSDLAKGFLKRKAINYDLSCWTRVGAGLLLDALLAKMIDRGDPRLEIFWSSADCGRLIVR